MFRFGRKLGAEPDSDKVAIWTGNPDDDVIVERSSKVDYLHGVPG